MAATWLSGTVRASDVVHGETVIRRALIRLANPPVLQRQGTVLAEPDERTRHAAPRLQVRRGRRRG